METTIIIDKLQEIFDDIFDESQPKVIPELTAADVLEWDSLSNIQLIVSIEREFGIKFSGQEVENLLSVGNLIDAIQDKKS